jgi:probable phosphoglycerate mutase
MPTSEGRNRVVLARHGETEWSKSGQHTSYSDIPLTSVGRERAKSLRPAMAKWTFALVLSSPLQRALETCRIAGLGDRAELEPDLVEWNYGEYEGKTTTEIRKKVPGWTVFSHPSPGGETPEQVAARVDRVIARARAASGDVALFAHGHVLRVLVARWAELDPRMAKHFLLDVGTISVLGWERDTPAIQLWNSGG